MTKVGNREMTVQLMNIGKNKVESRGVWERLDYGGERNPGNFAGQVRTLTGGREKQNKQRLGKDKKDEGEGKASHFNTSKAKARIFVKV